MSFVVALDGPAAAGKGTIARALSARFGFAHLDTGLLYRATGLRALREGAEVQDHPRLAHVHDAPPGVGDEERLVRRLGVVAADLLPAVRDGAVGQRGLGWVAVVAAHELRDR